MWNSSRNLLTVISVSVYQGRYDYNCIEGHLTHSGYEFRFILGLNRLISEETTDGMHHFLPASLEVSTQENTLKMAACEYMNISTNEHQISVNILRL